MPRIRYLKSKRLEYEADDIDFDEQQNEDASGETEVKRYESIENDTPSGSSWLSNASIIASFTDEQLKRAIRRYKDSLILLEAELRAREYEGRSITNEIGLVDKPKGRKQRSIQDCAIASRTRQRNAGDSKVQAVVNAEKFLRKSGIKNEALLATWIKIIAEKGEIK